MIILLFLIHLMDGINNKINQVIIIIYYLIIMIKLKNILD